MGGQNINIVRDPKQGPRPGDVLLRHGITWKVSRVYQDQWGERKWWVELNSSTAIPLSHWRKWSLEAAVEVAAP